MGFDITKLVPTRIIQWLLTAILGIILILLILLMCGKQLEAGPWTFRISSVLPTDQTAATKGDLKAALESVLKSGDHVSVTSDLKRYAGKRVLANAGGNPQLLPPSGNESHRWTLERLP